MQSINLISLRHSAFYTPFLMTFVADFLTQQGLAAHYRCANSVEELEAALLDGSADVAQSAVGISMRQLSNNTAQDNPIRHFAQINQRDGFFIASVFDNSEGSSKIDLANFNWKSLENKRIIADHLFQPMATLKYVLKMHEVNLDKIEFINSGNVEQSQAAFLSGQADFIHLQGPYPQQLVADGEASIVASIGAALGNIAYSSLCATSQWLDSTMANKFMRAYKAALNYVYITDASLLANQLSEQFEPIKQEVLCETIRAYKALGCWSKDACISIDSFESANKVFLHSGDISERVDYERVVSRKLF